MRVQRILAKGWVEVAVGVLWASLSVVGWATGHVAVVIPVWDGIALLALLFAARWPGWGLLAVSLVSVAGLAVDPGGMGLSSYICACAVALWVRRGEFWRASLGSFVVGACLAVVVLRRTSSGLVDGFVAPAIVLLFAWLIGVGFHWVAHVETERVSKEYTERQMRMAVDIHDFVGRNLTGVLARAEGATEAQRADPAFLDDLVRRVRSADTTLRDVTADLQRDGSARPFRTVGAVDALRSGVAELRAADIQVEQDEDAEILLVGLPPEVDLVVSRIVAEALHNVLTHADKSRPCRIKAVRDGDFLTIVVTNGVTHRPARGRRSLGLVGMRRHAALAGGTAVSAAEGDTWACRVTIPIDRQGVPT